MADDFLRVQKIKQHLNRLVCDDDLPQIDKVGEDTVTGLIMA